MGQSPLSVEERFWSKVYFPPCEDDCWTWTAGRTLGYGLFSISHDAVFAHRLAYELTHGSIPEGLQIDHLCRTPLGVNPAHLEAVTPRTNVLRGIGVTIVLVWWTCGQLPDSGER